MEKQNISEKIIEYLDGELPVLEETELFLALSQSEEFRAEMREHLQISRSISKDTDALVPPPNAIFSIGSALGIGTSKIIEESVPNASVTKSSWWTKFRLPLAFFVIASLITFTITYFAMKSENNQNIASSKAIVQTPPIVIASSEDAPRKAINSMQNNLLSPQIAVKEKTEAPANENLNSNVEEGNSVLITPNTLYNISKSASLKLASKQTLQNSTKYSNSNFEAFQFLSKEGVKKQSNSLVIRGITGYSFPNPNVEMQNTAFYSDMSSGLYFARWDNIKFGIEFGRESFGLKYKNTENNIEFFKEQKPMLYWAAVGFDYSVPYNIFTGFGFEVQPYVDILAGGSQIGGPLLKFITGLRFNPTSYSVGMFLGFEGSMLFYQNQRKFYLSKKIGLTYGLSINF